MSRLLEFLPGAWFAVGFVKVLLIAIAGGALIACIRQRDLAARLWKVSLLLLPLAFFSGLLPFSWRALPSLPSPPPITASVPANREANAPMQASREGAVEDLATTMPEPLPDTVTSRSPLPAAAPRALLTRRQLLTGIWITGGLLSLLPALFSLIASKRLGREATTAEISGAWKRVAGDAADFVPVRLSPDVASPGIAGIFRPEVILPCTALEWSPDHLGSVLRHELHHLRQHDIAWRWLGLLVRAALWFHPAPWWVHARLIAAQECAADEAVIAAGTPAADYAAHLLETAVDARCFPGIAMARRSQVGGRIRLLLARREASGRVRGFFEKGAGVCLGVLVTGLALLGFGAPEKARAAELLETADHGSRAPILDRNGEVIATSDPARMPETLRGNPPARWYPGGAMLAPVSGYTLRNSRGEVSAAQGSGLEDTPYLAKRTPLRSSIDIRIQRIAWEALVQRKLRGSVVVMDPRNGEVLAMASWPSFDPNQMADGFTEEEEAALRDDPRLPLLNRATVPDTPASLAKVLIALAAAKADKADRVIHCGPACAFGNVKIRDWKTDRDEDLDLVGAFRESCNTYFIPLAQELGPEAITQIGVDFGFGRKTALPWPGRATWYGLGRNEEPLSPIDLAFTAIGQGRTRYSLLDSARVMSAVASGQIRPPVFIAGAEAPETISFESLGIDERELALVRRGLLASAERLVPAVRDKGLRGIVAGKTSTAQSTSQHGENEHSANFAAYAPADVPRFVVAGRFWVGPRELPAEEGLSGSLTAAPVVVEVMQRLLDSGF